MKRPSTAAAILTTVAAVLILLLLFIGKLTLTAPTWPPSPHNTTELVDIDDEFVDLFDPSTSANPSPAYNDNNADNMSTPAEADGSDIVDAGVAAAPAQVITSKRQSPTKRVEKEQPKKVGADKALAEEEEARRRARAGVSNAFKSNDETADNTSSNASEKGDSGKTDGTASDLNGTGQGTVGGGWIMPHYAKVKSYQTGSIELRAIVAQDGTVKSVDLIGGKAPASGDPALVEKCKAEVRRHKFTRNDNNAPESATARIIYTFR